jgi:23S rRNA pseudouridine2605 synthase
VRKTERLNRYLSRCGLASRRKADELIAAGRVSVDGKVVRVMGLTIDPERARVAVDGKTVKPPDRFRYFAFNKPAGYLCSRGDPYGRPTIYDLLPRDLKDLKYVGRLDLDTEGLLLLTDDGCLIEKLTHPKYGLKRTYLAIVQGSLAEPDLAPLRRGIAFEGHSYRPAAAMVLRRSPTESEVRVEIREGQKREVRMMFRALGRMVLRLKRIRFGPIELRGLGPGKTSSLSPEEVSALKKSPS